MKAHLEHLIAHMHWANSRTLDSLQCTPAQESIRLFGHIVATEQIYHERIIGYDPWPQNFWPELSLEQSAKLLTRNHENFRALLLACTEDDFEAKVRYRNSKGTPYSTCRLEMVIHLTLHGEHHRGQIARIVREQGGEPAITDYITYTREREM